jgi:hypothetical protein
MSAIADSKIGTRTLNLWEYRVARYQIDRMPEQKNTHTLKRSKARPETMLRRLANDSKCPARIRLRAIELICVIEGRLKPDQVSQPEPSSLGDPLLRLLGEKPLENTGETDPAT